MSNCLNNAAARYGKPIIVAEDAFPWTNSCPASWTNSLYGYAPTTDSQVSFIAAVAQIVKSVPNQLCAGFFYWGAEYQAARGVNEAGYNTSSFFDFKGNALPVIDAIAGMAAPLVIIPTIDGSNLRLQWPFSGAAATLLTSTTINATTWNPVTTATQTTGSVFTVTLPIGNNTSFYKLH